VNEAGLFGKSARLLYWYWPPKKPGKKLNVESSRRSTPARRLCEPRT
jgi:hypothetical protein